MRCHIIIVYILLKRIKLLTIFLQSNRIALMSIILSDLIQYFISIFEPQFQNYIKVRECYILTSLDVERKITYDYSIF